LAKTPADLAWISLWCRLPACPARQAKSNLTAQAGSLHHNRDNGRVVLESYIELGCEERVRDNLRLNCRRRWGNNRGVAGCGCRDGPCRSLTAARTGFGRKGLCFGWSRRAAREAECPHDPEGQCTPNACGKVPVTPSRLADSHLLLSPFALACLTGTFTAASRNARSTWSGPGPPNPGPENATTLPVRGQVVFSCGVFLLFLFSGGSCIAWISPSLWCRLPACTGRGFSPILFTLLS